MLEDQVNVFIVLGPNDFFKLDDVGMTQLHEKHDFSVSTLGICRIVKSIEILLKSFSVFCFFVDYLPDVSIGSAADLALYLETGDDMRLYLLAH